LIKPPFNHHSTTAAPRHPHRNNHAILLPHQHRNNDAILLPRQHRNNAPIKLHALNIKLHTSLQTPSSTSNPSHHIKLLAPTTYTIHQARYNATSNNYPLNEHRVATFPGGKDESGEVSRAELPRKPCSGSSSAGFPPFFCLTPLLM